MYIIVIGGGGVGYFLTRILLSEGHEVLVTEKDRTRCEVISEELGEVAFRGDGCEARTLEELGTGRADMLIAVTGDDEDNLVACQVAKHRFNVNRTIARIKNPMHKEMFTKLGVDVTVSSTELILSHIEQELPSHPMVSLLHLKNGDLEIIEVKIPPDSKAVGKKLGSLKLPSDSLIHLIVGVESGAQIPSGETILHAEDEIVAVAKPGTEEEFRSAVLG